MSELDIYKREVIQFFKPYYTGADAAHGLQHVVTVMRRALRMNRELLKQEDERHVIVAAIAHDMFSFNHREDHQQRASRFIIEKSTEPILKCFDLKAILRISAAINEHRASYLGEYSSQLSELISAADRDAPNLKKIIKRIHACSIDTRLTFNTDDMELKQDGPEELFLERTLIHLKKKFGKSGYARYNTIYMEYYEEEHQALLEEIENITLENIKDYIYGK